ncbi:hypothetical protein PY793_03750 [Acetobacter fabarum]|uniref:hypothetical protein n=1 Tax=Acetobacter fabarum TaxID=483199 RepID=UPI00312B8373
MLRRFFLRQIVMGCLLVLAASLGLRAAHTPAQAAQTAIAHPTMHMAGHGWAGAPTQHNQTPAAINCPTGASATHHRMHHHSACCMTGNVLSVVEASAGILPDALLWHARARPVFATPPTLPDRRAAPLLRPPRLRTA